MHLICPKDLIRKGWEASRLFAVSHDSTPHMGFRLAFKPKDTLNQNTQPRPLPAICLFGKTHMQAWPFRRYHAHLCTQRAQFRAPGSSPKRVAGSGVAMDGFPLALLLLKAPGLLLIVKTAFSLADIFFRNGNPLDLMARHPLPKQIASLSEG